MCLHISVSRMPQTLDGFAHDKVGYLLLPIMVAIAGASAALYHVSCGMEGQSGD